MIRKVSISILLPLVLMSCSRFYYHPHKKMYFSPTKYGKVFQEESLKTKDGETISTWHIKKSFESKSDFLIVQFHGNAENMSTHFLSVEWLADFSCDVLTFDYRGYGKSSGSPYPKGLRQDSLALLDLAYQKYKSGNYKKLIVIGQSLGGIVALDAISKWDKRDSIDLLVLDSTFTSYKRMGMNILQKSWVTWLFSPIAWLILTNETAPPDDLSYLNMPKLVIHSKNDPVVDFKEGEKLFKKLSQPKKIWSYDHPSHIGAFYLKEPNYRKQFSNYLKEL